MIIWIKQNILGISFYNVHYVIYKHSYNVWIILLYGQVVLTQHLGHMTVTGH